MEKVKNLIFLIALFVFVPFACSESISSYKMDTNVSLNTNQVVTGVYSTETNDLNENVLCSFSVVDVNDFVVYRASDQYPQSNGYFTSEFLVYEPLLKQGHDYNVTVRCGAVTDTNVFRVELPENIEQPLIAGFFWFLEPANTFPLILIALFVIFAGAFFLGTFKR